MAPLEWRDTRHYYGRITRSLHWLIAVLLAWQFIGMGLSGLPGTGLVASTHKSMGVTLLVLIVLRALWGLSQLSHRPPHSGAERLIGLGHLFLYALMLVVPALGVAMIWGSGRSLSVWGVELFGAASGARAGGLAGAAHEGHELLAWTLGVLILGHIALALLWHGLVRRDGTLSRMAGPPR
ncbi:cytochrome b [Kushneria aurantia]|uniref:Cytochrome b n=1 Tax=Kushneria aurantia TaxID=504092 RepID=A0ABV6G7Q6_9GAMM|nr:cytochrome b/b6 domain-containing protein [Kushneria aurantia]